MNWKILGIEPTKDEEVIRSAYHAKLPSVNPEDDPEGFKALRRAYEEAMEYAQTTEEDEKEEMQPANEVDRWILKVEKVYLDVAKRRDPQQWSLLFRDPVCEALDTEMEASEKLLVFFMSHSFIPQAVWQLIDHRFRYRENMDLLKEKFPENYLEYIKWQIENPQFIDYDLFDGKTDADVDAYIGDLYDEKSAFEEGDLAKVRTLLEQLENYEVKHPYTAAERARYFMKLDAETSTGKAAEALSIMEDLDFQYSENVYIERIYAEALLANQKIEKARAIYKMLGEEHADTMETAALLGLAKCACAQDKLEDAKEMVEDVLEDHVQDMEALRLLDDINEEMVRRYTEQLDEHWDRDVCFKLGWCYYQQKEFEKGIELLDRVEAGEDYDYLNLRCRLYLATDQYDKAEPLVQKWLELIRNCEDDGSREAVKRKNRLSLALFSVGVCIWENSAGVAEGEKRLPYLEKAEDYIRQAIEEEKNDTVRFSYLEQLARFNLQAELYEKCIEICDRIIEQDRGFFPAYVHRQKANYKLKNAREVIDDYFACVEMYPPYAPPYIYAAEVFMAFEQYEDVQKVLDTAKDNEIVSDSLELIAIRMLHYKEFSKQNAEEALKRMEALRLHLETSEESDLEEPDEYYLELASLHWDLDRTAKALQVAEDGLKRCPGSRTLSFLKVDIFFREERYEEAKHVLQEMLKKDPEDLYTCFRYGNCMEYMQEPDKAIEQYEHVLEKNEEYVPAIRRMMYLYSRKSSRGNELDYESLQRGIEYAGKLIEQTDTSEGYVERGNLYIDLYELEKAVEDCTKAIELNPEEYYAYNNLGCALLKLRRAKEAVDPLEKAIAIDPDRDHLPYLNLAECYVLLKEYDKAIHANEEVLRLRPNANFVWKDIAKICILKKDYVRAIEIYQKLIDKNKKSLTDRKKGEPEKTVAELVNIRCEIQKLELMIADVYRVAGNADGAEKLYKKVNSLGRQLTGRYAKALEMAAEYYRDTGRYQKAEKLIRQALGLYTTPHDDKMHLYFTLATIEFELGKQKKAADSAEKFLQYQFRKTEEHVLKDARYRLMYLYELAIMNLCAGRLEKAEEYIRKMDNCRLCVMCETCDCFERYFAKGLLAELRGDKDSAQQLYRKAIAIKEDYWSCRHHLEKL